MPTPPDKTEESYLGPEEAGQVRRKRDRSDIAKSGDFSACPYCQ